MPHHLTNSSSASTGRRWLVISPVGDRSCHTSWTTGRSQRQFDLMLIYFGDQPHYDFGGAEYQLRRKGFKYHLLASVVEEFRELLAQYDTIWLPDDDIRTTPREIHQLFEIFERQQLLVAQPAIASGVISYQSLRQQRRTLLRYSPLVEVMCPIFARDYFLQSSALFRENQSAWGIDWIWSNRCAASQRAVIDAVGVHHTGVLMQGDLYQKLKARGINPTEEFHALVERYGGIDWSVHRQLIEGTLPMERIAAAGPLLALWQRLTNQRVTNQRLALPRPQATSQSAA